MTTKEDIRRWLENAKSHDCTHVIVVCDTFEYEDYPIFVHNKEDLQEQIKAHNNVNMQEIMEIYDLSTDIEKQLESIEREK